MNTTDYIEAFYAYEVANYPMTANRASGWASLVGMFSAFLTHGVSAEDAQIRIDEATAELRQRVAAMSDPNVMLEA